MVAGLATDAGAVGDVGDGVAAAGGGCGGAGSSVGFFDWNQFIVVVVVVTRVDFVMVRERLRFHARRYNTNKLKTLGFGQCAFPARSGVC